MRTRYRHRLFTLSLLAVVSGAASCGDGSTPTSPSGESSFLSGTWNGTLTISLSGGVEITGPTTWTFEIVSQTGRQTFNTTIRSQNSWMPVATTSTIVLTPTAEPPGQIGGTGHYNSPRGCVGDFVTTGAASATTIDVSFDGIDCDNGSGIRQPFSGRARLSK